MKKTDSIQRLIESKIHALGAEHITYEKNSSIDSISEIKVQEKALGVVIYRLLSTQGSQLKTLKSTHCSQYFTLSFCYRKDSNLPIILNGLSSLPNAEMSSVSPFPVSHLLPREFEDDLLLSISPDQRNLHLRIPLVFHTSSISHFHSAG